MEKYIRLGSGLFLLGVFSLFAYLMLISSFDVAPGWHACKFDEKLVFNTVKGLHLCETLREKFLVLVYGGPHMFGRITYYLPMLFSALPLSILGDSAFLASIRLVQATLLTTSYLLLVFFFIRRLHFRALALLALMVLPYTPYFSIVAKPEGILLLFLTIFLILVSRKGWGICYPWFFLGLAYGAKVSLLPFVLFLSIVSVLYFVSGNRGQLLGGIFKNILAFLSGLCIAAPTVIVLPQRYLEIFTKGAPSSFEDSSVDFFEWVVYISTSHFHRGSIFVAAFLGGGLVCLAVYFMRTSRCKNFVEVVTDELFVMVMGALSFLLPPMLFITRKIDRGHYLHIGLALLWIAIFMFFERKLDSGRFRPVVAKGFSLCFSIVLGCVLYPQLSWSVTEFTKLANYTTSSRFLQRQNDFTKFDGYIRSLSKKLGRPVTVNYDPSLLRAVPFISKDYITPYYNHSKPHDWKIGNDITLSSVHRSNYEGHLRSLPPTMKRYKMYADEYDAYKKHVVLEGVCLEKPCYQFVDLGMHDARMWVKLPE